MTKIETLNCDGTFSGIKSNRKATENYFLTLWPQLITCMQVVVFLSKEEVSNMSFASSTQFTKLI